MNDILSPDFKSFLRCFQNYVFKEAARYLEYLSFSEKRISAAQCGFGKFSVPVQSTCWYRYLFNFRKWSRCGKFSVFIEYVM